MAMVVRVLLVDVAVQEDLRSLSHMRVVLRLGLVVLELVGGETDSDCRPESPTQQANSRNPKAARTRHRVTVEDPRIPVNYPQSHSRRAG